MRVATIVVLAVVFLFGIWSAIDALTRGESLASALLTVLVAVLAFVTFVTAPDLTTVESDLSEIKQDSAAIRAQFQDQNACPNTTATTTSPSSSQASPNKIVGLGLLMAALIAVGILIGRRGDLDKRAEK